MGRDPLKQPLALAGCCAVLLAVSTMAFGQKPEAYVCVPDKSTGFAFNKSKGVWEYARFDTGARYVLSKNPDFPEAPTTPGRERLGAWLWKEVGKQEAQRCYEFTELGYTQCSGFLEVSFNRKNLRYMAIYKVGYVQAGISGEEGRDTPSIEIGRCSRL